MLARSVGSSLSRVLQNLQNRGRFVVARCQPLFLSVNLKKDCELPSILIAESCQKHSNQVNSEDGAVCGHWQNSARNPAVLDSDTDVKKPTPVAIHLAIANHLLPHQFEGVQFMYDNAFGSLAQGRNGVSGGGCILADAPGLGKTFQCIAFIHAVLPHPVLSAKVKKILILAPTNVIINWRDEFNKWLNIDGANLKTFDVTVLNLVPRKNRLPTLMKWHNGDHPSVMISSYGMYRQSLEDSASTESAAFHKYLQNPGPDMIFFDEAHMFKNLKTKYANLLSKLKTKLRICITGTPVQNHLREYYIVINVVRPGVLGDRKHFNQAYATPITKGGTKDATPFEVQRMKSQSYILYETLKPYVLRRDSSVLAHLISPMLDYAVIVRPSPAQIRVYQDLLRLLPVVRGEKKWMKQAMTNYFDLSPVWLHPLQPFSKVLPDSVMKDFGLSSKLVLLMEIIKACEKVGDKLLVFSTSVDSLKLIKKMLQHYDECNQWHVGADENWGWKEDFDFSFIHGETSPVKRDSIRSRFNDPNNQRIRLSLISTKSGSQGTSWTGANRVVIFDASWNHADDFQARCRVYRIGQTKPTFVYRLIAQGTMEERIYNRQVTRTSTSHRVLDEHQILRQFTAAELEELYHFKPIPYVEGDERKLDPPKDRLLANLIQSHPEAIVSYKVHTDYFVNQVDEHLTDEEREAAWQNHKQFESNEDTFPGVNQ
uniref:Helicase ATP-binding domain-containing protein n=1 Tax=Panagrellus redivivus TaxID=6233 RepID=A0A7E4UXT0_PANRE